MTIDYIKLGRFGSVGGLGAIVYFLSLWLMVEKFHFSVMLATSLSFILVIIINYVLHYHWTFDSNRSHRSTFPRFVLISITGFSLNWGIMYIGTVGLDYNYLLIQTLSIVVVVTWNLVMSTVIFQPKNYRNQDTDSPESAGRR